MEVRDGNGAQPEADERREVVDKLTTEKKLYLSLLHMSQMWKWLLDKGGREQIKEEVRAIRN